MANVSGGMQRWAGRVALVTGASAGIGQAIARALVRHGMAVFSCARNIKAIEDDIKSLAADGSISGSLHAIKCDLAREDEILAMFAEIKEKCGGVDVCINNAGILHGGTMKSPMGILNGETDKWRDMLNVNVLAAAICAREAFKQMEEKGAKDGQIIMINRVVPMKEVHFYSATKYATTAMVEGIRQELLEKHSGIRVAAISPGIVHTSFRERMYPNDDPEETEKMYEIMESLKPEDVTDSVLYVLQAPPHVQVHDVIIQPINQF